MDSLKELSGLITFVVTPPSILKDARESITRSRELHESLTRDVSASSATFENVLVPLAEAENALITTFRRLVFYESVSPDANVREASAQAKSLFEAFKLETAMNEGLFALVDAVSKGKEGLLDLDAESRRLLEKVHQDHTVNGLSLSVGSAERERFMTIKKRIGELEGMFMRNLAKSKTSSGGLWFTRAELAGLPESLISRLEMREHDHEEQRFRVSFNNSDLFPTLKFAENPATRKRMYIASERICASSVPIFQEAVLLRDEAARLLGYASHAAFSTRDKMAKDPETVNKFLLDLKKGLITVAAEDLRHKKDLKRQHVESRGENYDGQFFLWDSSFYNSLALREWHAVDQQLLSEYFEINTVKSAILEMMQNLFGLRFTRISTDHMTAEIWHEDVELYSVWESDETGGHFVGYQYLDLFAREGKASHACSLNLKPSTHNEFCATALLCSFSKPVSEQPTLLRHDEVVLFFHELGHCIHDLASKPRYARFHGPDGTAVDFSEAPSQLLEYWFWTPSVLRKIGRHYSYLSGEFLRSWIERSPNGSERPSENLSEDSINQLLASKNMGEVATNRIMLTIALFDMSIHSPENYEVLTAIDPSSMYNSIRKEVCQLQDPTDLGEPCDWGSGFATYPHLMDGYDAGFYSYLFSKVFAADIFYSMFAKDPMNTRESLRYRRAVLEKGGIRGDLQNLTEYLGREPKVDAFYHALKM
ncbi:metallopeptidase MepB [Truncatella angustata]|uniref:Metallopeptidase MepB n=1 Tax=Truncatella angustata TaxID=152316 RepID=A0A9P8UWW1_9PEZI|nr:metallopeptidase MepB [Truncatella angustata]KAH6659444.1 metallopeptidase MepB [Truncatella angustata]